MHDDRACGARCFSTVFVLGANFQREELLCDEKGDNLMRTAFGGRGLFQHWNR